jgi:hypothetical protein
MYIARRSAASANFTANLISRSWVDAVEKVFLVRERASLIQEHWIA